jgi:hypothetical protein
MKAFDDIERSASVLEDGKCICAKWETACRFPARHSFSGLRRDKNNMGNTAVRPANPETMND